jgi:Cdc6-like AAA superfamily ATPase
MFIFNLAKSFKRLPTGGGCISNTLSNYKGYIARYNTKVDALSDRKQELIMLRNAFSDGYPDTIHVVLGPPSSGKTALVREITSKGNFSPLIIDCRSGQFIAPTSIYNTFCSQFKSFFDKHTNILKNTEPIRIGFKDFNIECEDRTITSSDVTWLLFNIYNYLPNWSFWKSYNIPPPILIIDEANMMFTQLGNDNPALLKSILSWLVLITKGENRLPVVLTSSNSFILNWIVNRKSILSFLIKM